MESNLRLFLMLATVVRVVTIVAGLLLAAAGAFLLSNAKSRSQQQTVDLEIDAKQGRIVLKGAIPAVVLITLGAAAILFAMIKPMRFEEKQPDGGMVTGIGGPDSRLQYLPPLLDSLVRGDSASPAGMTLEDEELGGAYFPVEILGRAWEAESACERMLESAWAGDSVHVSGTSGRTLPAPPYFVPPLLDSIVRGSLASRTGFVVSAAEYQQLSPQLRNRLVRLLEACENVITLDAQARRTTLGERVRTEGV